MSGGIYITKRGGTWEEFWKGKLRDKEKVTDCKSVNFANLWLGALWGFTILVAMFFLIIRGIWGNVIDEPFFDIYVIVTGSYLIAVMVIVVIWQLTDSIRAANFKIKPENEERAIGTVRKAEVTFTGELNNRVTRETFKISIKVDGIKELLLATLKVRYGKKANNVRVPKRNERIMVAYDRRKPRFAKILDEKVDKSAPADNNLTESNFVD